MDTAHFTLLFLIIAIYMLVGSAIFSSLERPAALLDHQLWETRLKDFSKEHNITFEELKSLLCHYEDARTADMKGQGPVGHPRHLLLCGNRCLHH